MSAYEKHDDEEGEYMQNIEHFEDVNPTEKDFDIGEIGRVFGGRDFDVEETIGERFLGLTEMLPNCLRESSIKVASCMESLVKKSFSCACNFWWAAFVMSAVIFSPIIYEHERLRDEERRARRRFRGHGPNVATTS